MSRGLKFQVEIELLTEECINCGMAFGVPANVIAQRRRDHQSFYCPAGHSQVYLDETREEALKRQLQEAEAKHTREMQTERNRRLRAEEDAMNLAKSNSAIRGQVTKLKNRAAAGVCAFCNRTFQNVARHVQSKHPHPEH